MHRVNEIFKKESRVAAAEVWLTLSIPKYWKCALCPTKSWWNIWLNTLPKEEQNLISDPLEEGGMSLSY